MKIALILLLVCSFLLGSELRAQDLRIYQLVARERGAENWIGLVSLSDSYFASDHPVAPVVPVPWVPADSPAPYLQLDSSYRSAFLANVGVSENDKVFLYDYASDVLLRFAVRELALVAYPSIYTGRNDWPYSQEEYQVGFEFGPLSTVGLGKYFSQVLVFIGRESPFVRGQMKPMDWQKCAPNPFTPLGVSVKDPIWNQSYLTGDSYVYATKRYKYFVQNLLLNGRMSARRLIVVDLETKAVVAEKMFQDHESASPCPLNFVEQNYGIINQFAGVLFKHRPSVFLGFSYISFGCESISFVDPKVPDLYILCDNRH